MYHVLVQLDRKLSTIVYLEVCNVKKQAKPNVVHDEKNTVGKLKETSGFCIVQSALQHV
jgi:hypothetical protein